MISCRRSQVAASRETRFVLRPLLGLRDGLGKGIASVGVLDLGG